MPFKVKGDKNTEKLLAYGLAHMPIVIIWKSYMGCKRCYECMQKYDKVTCISKLSLVNIIWKSYMAVSTFFLYGHEKTTKVTCLSKFNH